VCVCVCVSGDGGLTRRGGSKEDVKWLNKKIKLTKD